MGATLGFELLKKFLNLTLRKRRQDLFQFIQCTATVTTTLEMSEQESLVRFAVEPSFSSIGPRLA